MQSERDIFEDLIWTIERSARDNEVTITDVALWAKSWRQERYRDRVYSNEYQTVDWNKLDRSFYWVIFSVIVGQSLIPNGFLLKLLGY